MTHESLILFCFCRKKKYILHVKKTTNTLQIRNFLWKAYRQQPYYFDQFPPPPAFVIGQDALLLSYFQINFIAGLIWITWPKVWSEHALSPASGPASVSSSALRHGSAPSAPPPPELPARRGFQEGTDENRCCWLLSNRKRGGGISSIPISWASYGNRSCWLLSNRKEGGGT